MKFGRRNIQKAPLGEAHFAHFLPILRPTSHKRPGSSWPLFERPADCLVTRKLDAQKCAHVAPQLSSGRSACELSTLFVGRLLVHAHTWPNWKKWRKKRKLSNFSNFSKFFYLFPLLPLSTSPNSTSSLAQFTSSVHWPADNAPKVNSRRSCPALQNGHWAPNLNHSEHKERAGRANCYLSSGARECLGQIVGCQVTGVTGQMVAQMGANGRSLAQSGAESPPFYSILLPFFRAKKDTTDTLWRSGGGIQCQLGPNACLASN